MLPFRKDFVGQGIAEPAVQPHPRLPCFHDQSEGQHWASLPAHHPDRWNAFSRLSAKTNAMEADLLVAADGSRSRVRSVLFPDLRPGYAGYVAWRGVVTESGSVLELLSTCADQFSFQQVPRSHVLYYLIPSAEGRIGYVVLECPGTRPRVGADRMRWEGARLFGASGTH
jgi:2-polyprenyl-6-methoxyphenol hydroxylase-like FAD-dependent oxidoreductase